MRTYQIVTATPESVYCVVTLDNGETFGQTVHGEASKTEAGIQQAIREAVGRIESQKQPRQREQKVVDTALSRTAIELPVNEIDALP